MNEFLHPCRPWAYGHDDDEIRSPDRLPGRPKSEAPRAKEGPLEVRSCIAHIRRFACKANNSIFRPQPAIKGPSTTARSRESIDPRAVPGPLALSIETCETEVCTYLTIDTLVC
jgi:hypothetical protein